MDEELVKSFLQRLDSVLLKEKEALSGLEDQIERVVNKLREIAESSDDRTGTKEDADDTSSPANELRDFIDDIENRMEKLIIQMDKQHESDRTARSGCFRNEIQMIESRLAETIHRMRQPSRSAVVKGETEEKNSPVVKEGQASASSSSVSFESNCVNLSEDLQNCLMYCCMFPENFWIPKGKLIRLLVAEDLIKEEAERVMEDIAEGNINELVGQGMLQVNNERTGQGNKLQVPSPIRDFFLLKIKEGNFTTSSASSSDSSTSQPARRVLTDSDVMESENLPLQSLFLIGHQKPFEEKGNCLKSSGAKFLRVLDLENNKIQRLPDEVGDMIQLRYLGLKHTGLTELPVGLGNLIDLQTLDIRWCGKIKALPNELLNLARLRHLKMFQNEGMFGVKLPEGIRTLTNLLTLTGINASGGIAEELGHLPQLRRLEVMCVAEEHISELLSSIMNMQGLLSLSLQANRTFDEGKLVLLDSFSPPPFLRKLQLEGLLEKVPSWLGSLERLTNIRLGFSHLSENPTLALQLLPSLKTLTLWHAYDAKQIGKEFCEAGGFPKLEVLSIASRVLEEWTDLEEGALPSLKCLNLHNCLKLRMLPEGLQFVTTLKKLNLLPLMDELEERLKPDGGQENYKIGHIPEVSFITTSSVRRRANCTSSGVQIGAEETKSEV